MILLIDNYDSFTYNLVQYIGALEPDIRVVRNDVCTLAEIEEMHPQAIVISPGPGKPSDAGICEACIIHFAGKVPILGVCLGHQAICEAFGGVVDHAGALMHGKASIATLDTENEIFKGLESREQVARYHSLSAKEETLPSCLKVIARTDDGEVMAVSHSDYAIFGLQFHPESILTPDGNIMLDNFLKIGLA